MSRRLPGGFGPPGVPVSRPPGCLRHSCAPHRLVETVAAEAAGHRARTTNGRLASMRTMVRLSLVTVLVAGLAGACSSDGGTDPGSSATSTSVSTPAGRDASAEVAQYCADTQEVGAQLEAAVTDADASSTDATDVVERANALAEQAAPLSTAHPDEVNVINQCAAQLSVSPGG